MKEYHKIQTVFLRDPETKFKTLLESQWAKPEFGWLANNEWVMTEKVDGTNIRVIWDGATVQFAGKTDRAQIPAPLLEHLYGHFTPSRFNGLDPMTLYGEGYGAKIQKGGGNYRPDQHFILFDVFCGLWLERENVHDIACTVDCEVVPVATSGPLEKMVNLCRNGFQSMWGDFQAEGLVARPAIELLNRRGERIITKLKCKDFRNE